MKSNRLAHLIASGLGSGYTPWAPGTCGSLACLALWLILKNWNCLLTTNEDLFILCAVALAGWIATERVLADVRADTAIECHQNARALRDPSFVVIDEWLGLLLALFATQPHQAFRIALAFTLFRLFDVVKPGPVRWAEKLPRAWGIMADDALAGLFALSLTQILAMLLGT